MALPPSWDRKNLPEEEIQVLERVPPPQVDKKEHSTGKWILAAPTVVKDEILNNNEEIKLPRKQEVLNNNDLDDSTEVTVLDSSCVIRYAIIIETLFSTFPCKYPVCQSRPFLMTLHSLQSLATLIL